MDCESLESRICVRCRRSGSPERMVAAPSPDDDYGNEGSPVTALAESGMESVMRRSSLSLQRSDALGRSRLRRRADEHAPSVFARLLWRERAGFIVAGSLKTLLKTL